MRADIQRKLLGFQELTSPVYRCVSICVTRLIRLQQTLAHPLVIKPKDFWSKHLTLPRGKIDAEWLNLFLMLLFNLSG